MLTCKQVIPLSSKNMLTCQLMMYECWFCMHVELFYILTWKHIGCIEDIIIIMSFSDSWNKIENPLYSFIFLLRHIINNMLKCLKTCWERMCLRKFGLNPSMWMNWFSINEWDRWSECMVSYIFNASFSMWYGLSSHLY